MNRIESKDRRTAPAWVAGFFVSATLFGAAAGTLCAQDRDDHAGHDHAGHAHEPVADVQAVRVHKQLGPLSYDEITVNWEDERFVPGPPYLADFRLLEPSGPVGSYLQGTYLGGSAMHNHVILFPAARVQYAVNATDGPDDLALAVSAQWPEFSGPQPDSLLTTLTLTMDTGDSLDVPVALRPSRSFFAASGAGRPYSLPQVLVLDLPAGRRTVTVRVSARPSSFAIVTAGIPLAPDGETSPVPLGDDPSARAYPERNGAAPEPGGTTAP